MTASLRKQLDYVTAHGERLTFYQDIQARPSPPSHQVSGQNRGHPSKCRPSLRPAPAQWRNVCLEEDTRTALFPRELGERKGTPHVQPSPPDHARCRGITLGLQIVPPRSARAPHRLVPEEEQLQELPALYTLASPLIALPLWMAPVQVPMCSSTSCSTLQDRLRTLLSRGTPSSAPLQGNPSEGTVRAARAHGTVQGAVGLEVTRTSPGEAPARLVLEIALVWSGEFWRLQSARTFSSRP